MKVATIGSKVMTPCSSSWFLYRQIKREVNKLLIFLRDLTSSLMFFSSCLTSLKSLSSCSSRLTGSRFWRNLSRICKRKELRSLSTSSPMEARPWKWIWQQGDKPECFWQLLGLLNKSIFSLTSASDLVWQTALWNKWFGRISLRPDSLLPRKKSLAPDWGNRFWLLLAWKTE